MANRSVVTGLVTVSAVAWAALLLFGGTPLPTTFFDPLTKVAAGLVLLLTVFDKWLWRFLPQWLVKVPRIAGTWEVELQSNWIDPATGNLIGAVKGFLVVRQTYSTVDARLLTAESRSHQLAASLVRAHGGDEFSLVAVYRNEPSILIRERSGIHFGALILHIPAGGSTSLFGEYWTDRTTCGQLSGRNRQGKRFSSFIDAEAHWVTKGLRAIG
jgi:hypothetical protein